MGEYKMPMNTLDYYNLDKCKQIFNSVENSNWRIWKVINDDKSCIQNPFIISTPEKLYKFIHFSTNPIALYVSVSTFLNPQVNHGYFEKQKKEYNGRYYYPQAGYLKADCILLDSYFFIDVDSKGNLRTAQEDGRKIINHLSNNDEIKLHNVQFSGSKGVHLIYKLRNRQINTISRIDYYKNHKKELANELIKLGLKTIDINHLNIMQDIFRVYSAPYSIKSNGNIVQPLDVNKFMKEDIHSLINLPEVRDAQKADDKKVPNSNMLDRRRADLSSYPHIYMCIANFVPGLINNYVPFIKINKKRFNKINLKELSNHLSTMLIFEETNYYWIISLKLFQKPALLKIMRKLKAVNFSEFARRYAKFRYTDILDNNKNKVEPPPRLIKVIPSDKEYTYSRAHHNFFKEVKIDDNLLRGTDTLKTYLAKVRT